jgi:hypothetical protein
MLVRELVNRLAERDPEGEVVVVLFTVDGTASQFIIDAVEVEDNTIRRRSVSRADGAHEHPKPNDLFTAHNRT